MATPFMGVVSGEYDLYTRRITIGSNRLRAAVTVFACAKPTPVPSAASASQARLRPCSRLIQELYGHSLRMEEQREFYYQVHGVAGPQPAAPPQEKAKGYV